MSPLVVVTRQLEAAASLVEALERHRLRVWHVPTTATSAPEDSSALDAAIEALGNADWLVVTSVRAIEAMRARDAWRDGLRATGTRLKVASVGPATSRILRAAGLDIAIESRQAGAADLAAQLTASGLAGKHVIWPRSARADDRWIATVEQAGARVTAPVAYCTVDVPMASLAPLRQALVAGEVDAVTFCSPSSALSLSRAFDGSTLHDLAGRVVVAALGPTTAAALEHLGAPPDVVARAPEPRALADDLARHLTTVSGERA